MIFSDGTLSQIVRRAGLRASDGWIGIITPIEPDTDRVVSLREEAEIQALPVPEVITVGEMEPFALGQLIQSRGDSSLLLTGFDSWSPSRWKAADLNRNTWLRGGGVTWLVLGPTGASRMAGNAPNLRSVLGSFLVLSPNGDEMGAEEVARRLEDLRAHYNRTDAAVIQAASDGKLELSPHMVEWLILLDRGDLV
jgi:hypothetical protein